MTTTAPTLKAFKSSFIFRDIATRGDDVIALSLFLVGQHGVEMRFAAHSNGGVLGAFTHFTPRAQKTYKIMEDGKLTGEEINGVHLNRINIPLFAGKFDSKSDFRQAIKENKLVEKLTEFIIQQLVLEGFTPVADIMSLVDEALNPPAPQLMFSVPPPDIFKALGAKDSNEFYGQKAQSPQTSVTSPDDEDEEEEEDDEFDVN